MPPPPPDPQSASSPGEFVAAMRALAQWSDLSLRQLERRAEAAGMPPQETIAAALESESLPRLDVLVAFTRACGLTEDEIAGWVAVRTRVVTSPPPDEPVAPRHRVSEKASRLPWIIGAVSVLCVLILVLVLPLGGKKPQDPAMVTPPSQPVPAESILEPVPSPSLSASPSPSPSKASPSPSAAKPSTVKRTVKFSVSGGCLGVGPKVRGRTTLAQTSCASGLAFELVATGGAKYRLVSSAGCVSAFGSRGGNTLHLGVCGEAGAEQDFLLDGQRIRPQASPVLCAESPGAGQSILLRGCSGGSSQTFAVIS